MKTLRLLTAVVALSAFFAPYRSYGAHEASRTYDRAPAPSAFAVFADPTLDGLIARAMAAGATAAKVGGAGGGGCLFCYGPPAAREAIRTALADGGARLLDYSFERHGLARG